MKYVNADIKLQKTKKNDIFYTGKYQLEVDRIISEDSLLFNHSERNNTLLNTLANRKIATCVTLWTHFFSKF